MKDKRKSTSRENLRQALIEMGKECGASPKEARALAQEILSLIEKKYSLKH